MNYRLRKTLLILVAFFMMFLPLAAQNETIAANSIIKKSLLLKDLEILKKNLEEAQPGLYNYTPKEEMDSSFAAITNKISGDMSSLDFFRLIAPLSNKIRNGHTILVPSSSWEDHVVTEKALLPLDLYYYNDQLYIVRNLSDQKDIKEGSILKSINGQSAIEAFTYMVDRWFKDGYNTTRPREIVEEEFRLLYAHFFETSSTYKIDIITPDKENQSFEIQGIKEPNFKNRLKQRYQKEFIPWWRRSPQPLSLKFEGNTAYLAVTQFNGGLKSKDGLRFGKFVKRAFKTIKDKKIANLVLDLRGNQGGDVKEQLELLRHLINKPFHLYKDVYANVRKLPNPDLYEFNLINRTQFKKNFNDEKVNGVYPMKNRIGFEERPQDPSENVFEGSLYVLIDGWSFSATGEVTGMLKEHRKDAVFVGEETGGNPVTNISGIQTFMTLPHSKNRILICLVSYTANVNYDNDGRGVQPHHLVRNTVFDELEGKDATLAKVNELITNQK